MIYEDITGRIIGAAIDVHRELGPGLLESAYTAALAWEFSVRNLPFKRESPLPVEYKGSRLDCGYRLDFVIAEKVILELKTADAILPIHEAQLLTYMRLAKIRVGLLINFNVLALKDGIKRMVL